MNCLHHYKYLFLSALLCVQTSVGANLSSRQRTAYHEAGHVVASILLDVDFDYVSMELKQKHGHYFEDGKKIEVEAEYTEGVVWSKERRAELNKQVIHGVLDLREAIVSVAGPIAEALIVGSVDQEVKDAATDDEQYINAACRAALSRGKPFEEWSATNLESAIIKALRSEAMTLMKGNWQAVEEIAQALLKKGTLTRQQTEVIVRKD